MGSLAGWGALRCSSSSSPPPPLSSSSSSSGSSASTGLGVTRRAVFLAMPADGAFGKDYFHCEGVQGAVATGGTWPVPPCFSNNTVQQP